MDSGGESSSSRSRQTHERSAGSGTGGAGRVDSYDEQLSTDHLKRDLRGRTVSSAAVTLAAQAVKFGLTLGSTAALARLLSPADFGLVAQVTAVTGFLRVFREAGLSVATVQRETITHAQVSNLFWINVAISVLLTLTVAGLAPLLAWFYRDERLVPLTLAVSLSYLIGGSGIQHRAILQRQMRFRAKAAIEVGSLIAGIGTGVVMALYGFRYWSLVGSTLVLEATAVSLTWLASGWRPQLPKRGVGTRPLLRFGAARTAGDFLITVARGCDRLLIGRLYTPDAVGFYTRASALLIAPLQQILLPFNTVFIPTLSRLQGDPVRYRNTFLRLYGGIALLSFFSTAILLALAKPVTLFMLGDQWGPAAPILSGFTFAALCIPLANSAGWLFISQGRGGDMLKSQSTFAAAMLVGFVAGVQFGPVGVAVGFSVVNVIVRIPVTYAMAGRSGPVSSADLWRVLLRHLPIWVVVYAVSALTLAWIGTDSRPITQIAIAGVAGGLAGVAAVAGIRSQREVALYFAENLLAVIRRRKNQDS